MALAFQNCHRVAAVPAGGAGRRRRMPSSLHCRSQALEPVAGVQGLLTGSTSATNRSASSSHGMCPAPGWITNSVFGNSSAYRAITCGAERKRRTPRRERAPGR
ncbi:hypothetical protein ACRAWF_03865 [Streptomyces sp. L7]